jgi:hypothetical protein
MPHPNERLRSRHPFQLYMLTVTAVYGIIGSATRGARPPSVVEVLGPLGSLLWCLFLAVGGVGALVGVAIPDRATGLTLEASGCLLVGAATTYYAAVATWSLGWDAAILGLVGGFGLACVARAWQIHRVLRVAADRHRGRWRA